MHATDAQNPADAFDEAPEAVPANALRLPVLALAVFAAFVVFGALGGWDWFLGYGESRYEPRPLEHAAPAPAKHAANPF